MRVVTKLKEKAKKRRRKNLVTIEEIIELKVNALVTNISLEKSLAFHLDTYLQILDYCNAENEKLRLTIEKLIDGSKNNYLKQFK